jgi:hypothetical protein
VQRGSGYELISRGRVLYSAKKGMWNLICRESLDHYRITTTLRETKMAWQSVPSLLIIGGAFNAAAGLLWGLDRLYYGRVSVVSGDI